MTSRSTIAAILISLLVAACGGTADPPPPDEPEAGGSVPPTITQQPQSISVTAGQPAAFSVAASGTAPITYQWQRDGADIAGATSTTYTLPAVAVGDSGAVFRAVARNVAGSATSNDATLTVTTAAPVLTITQQPADVTVTAGTQASFTVAATCSSGTLQIQWQRNGADIAGATAVTYAFGTVLADSGAHFRAALSCGGQSATTSNTATLTVNPPASVTLSLLPIVGLRPQADLSGLGAIDQLPDGSYAFITRSAIKRLATDRLSVAALAGAGSFNDGSTDGPAATATFNQPEGLTHDAAGVIYVADTQNHVIRRIGTDGTVSTLAGSAGVFGQTDGTGSAARFNSPAGIALGPDGDLYVADRGNTRIRRVTTAGVVTTYAGSNSGFADGAPLVAQFNSPTAIAVAANNDVLVADFINSRVRRIVRSGSGAGSVETLAGNGSALNPGADGVGAAAGIPFPFALVVRGNQLFVRDGGGLVRQVDLTTRAVVTFTGSRTLGAGYADGAAGAARFDTIGGLTTAPGNGLVASDNNRAIRTIDAAGNTATIAARGVFDALPSGTGVLAQLEFALAVNRGNSLVVDPSGNVLVAEYQSLLRRIATGGNVSLVAGLSGGFHGVVDGVGSAAQFADVGAALAIAPNGTLYASDDFVVRKVATDGTVTTVAGSTTQIGAADGIASTARFNSLLGLAVGPTGDVFGGDAGNFAVRRIDAAGNVTTYAGALGQSGSADGPIATARFRGPRQLAFAPDGSLYVVDSSVSGGALRRISADGAQVSTVAAAGGQLGTIAIGSDGTIYFGTTGGFFMLPPGAAAATLLIPVTGSANVFGSNPSLFGIQSMAVLGPKQIVMISGGQIVVATLP